MRFQEQYKSKKRAIPDLMIKNNKNKQTSDYVSLVGIEMFID